MAFVWPDFQVCSLVCVLARQLQKAKCRVKAGGETRSLWVGLCTRTSVSSEDSSVAFLFADL